MTEQTTARLKTLRQRMAETGTGLVAIAPGSHMDWVLGFHPHPDERPCLLLVGREKETFLMPALNAEGTREFTDIPFHNWADDEGPDAALCAALSAIDAGAPGLVALDETMRADFALLLIDALPADTRRDFTPATLGGLRMRKDDSEYAKLKMNAGISDRAMQAAFVALRPGMSEKDVAAEIRAHFASEGWWHLRLRRSRARRGAAGTARHALRAQYAGGRDQPRLTQALRKVGLRCHGGTGQFQPGCSWGVRLATRNRLVRRQRDRDQEH